MYLVEFRVDGRKQITTFKGEIKNALILFKTIGKRRPKIASVVIGNTIIPTTNFINALLALEKRQLVATKRKGKQ